jgi:hypothetical protein
VTFPRKRFVKQFTSHFRRVSQSCRLPQPAGFSQTKTRWLLSPVNGSVARPAPESSASKETVVFKTAAIDAADTLNVAQGSSGCPNGPQRSRKYWMILSTWS